MAKNLKAYIVSCHDDDHGGVVVFAQSVRSVDRRENSERCDCEFLERTIRRAPEFDDLAPGPVTVKEYIDRGWHWSCSGCSEEHLTKRDNPIYISESAYCDEKCVEKFVGHWSDSKSPDVIIEIDAARKYLQQRTVPTN